MFLKFVIFQQIWMPLEGNCLPITLIVNLPWKLALTIFVLWRMIFVYQHSWFSKIFFFLGYVAYNQWVSFHTFSIETHNVEYSGICESYIMQRQSHMSYIITHKFEPNLFHVHRYASFQTCSFELLGVKGWAANDPFVTILRCIVVLCGIGNLQGIFCHYLRIC